MSKGGRRGNLVAGIILVGLGAVFILRDTGLFSFGQVWPLVLIAVGIYLLILYFLEQRPSA